MKDSKNICSICNKDLNKEMHAFDCPYVGLGNENLAMDKVWNTGWKCPVCKKVFSPLTSECKYCNEDKNNI